MTPQTDRALTPVGGMVMDVDVGDGFTVTVPGQDQGCRITITLLYKAGRRARLRVSTDEDVSIRRKALEAQNATG